MKDDSEPFICTGLLAHWDPGDPNCEGCIALSRHNLKSMQTAFDMFLERWGVDEADCRLVLPSKDHKS
jgi:hypothetical protein